MRIKLLFICFICLQCSDLINSSYTDFDSIYLDGGSWIQIENRGELFVDENSLDILENGEFSIEFWLSNQMASSTDSPALFTIGNDENEIELGVFQNVNKSNELRIYHNNTYVKEFEIESLDWNEENKFYYILFVFDNSKLEMFFDGEYIGNVTIEQGLEFSGNDIFVGAKGFKNYTSEPTNFWTGNFDEIRIWKKPLSNIFYFSNLYTDIDLSASTITTLGNITLIDADNDNNTECLIIDNWNYGNEHYQEIENLHDTSDFISNGYNNCVCYNQEIDGIYDCWNITSLVNYHNEFPNQIISKYGDPLINELISLLKFDKYGFTISDESGNDNDAYIYSLPNHQAEFVETGY